MRVTLFGKDAAISYSGKIKNVNPSIDENGQIEVCAVLDGASSLINGMNVKVTVDKVLDSRLVVPKSAVVVRDNLNVLFVTITGVPTGCMSISLLLIVTVMLLRPMRRVVPNFPWVNR